MKQKTKDIERLVNQMSTINHNMISFLGCACTWAIRRVLNSTSLASFDGEPRVVRKIKIRGFALLAFVSTAHQSFICWRKTIANARGVNILSCKSCPVESAVSLAYSWTLVVLSRTPELLSTLGDSFHFACLLCLWSAFGLTLQRTCVACHRCTDL